MAHRYQNIAVSGRIAVGSTSLAKALSQKLSWSLREGNQIFRDISAQMGFDLEKNPQKYGNEIDIQVDNDTISILKSLSPVVVCSKLACFLSRDIAHTLKVLVIAPLDIRVQRYSQDRGYKIAEAQRLIDLREQEDQKKFVRLYGQRDFFDPEYFNLIIDSSKLSISAEVKKVLQFTANFC